MIDWTRIIEAFLASLPIVVPALIAAYIQLRRFRAENNAANAKFLAEQATAKQEAKILAEQAERQRFEIARRGKQASIAHRQEDRTIAAELREERQLVAEKVRATGDKMLALGENILINVNGNLEKTTAKLNEANAKIDELKATVMHQEKLLTPAAGKKYDPAALDALRERKAAAAAAHADADEKKKPKK